MSKDCCDCLLERATFSLGAVANDDLTVPAGTDPGGDDTQRTRGVPAGTFAELRPVKAVVHSDWCSHRPTKATVAVSHNTAAPNGTVRVFVEGRRDFSHYVWAEMECEAGILFPDLDARLHTVDGIAAVGGRYLRRSLGGFQYQGPMFGLPGNTWIYQPRNAQDGQGYLQSPWPMWQPTFATQSTTFAIPYNAGVDISGPVLPVTIAWQGTRCRVRWGYRHDNADTVLGSRVFAANQTPRYSWFSGGFEAMPPGSLGRLGIGCNWADIDSPNEEATVRCGVELYRTAPGLVPHPIQNLSSFGGFTIPFELPRSFFVDAESEAQPPPPMPYQLVGVEATAPRLSVPISHNSPPAGAAGSFAFGDSTNLDATEIESIVTCGARRANVFIPPALQSEDGTLPAGGTVGATAPPADGIIRPDFPLFVRRPDLNDRSFNHVANADSWHATHLVRAGSPLAGSNALHNLHIEFFDCTFPHGIRNGASTPQANYFTIDANGNQPLTPRYFTPSPLRTGLEWTSAGAGGWSPFGGPFTVTPADAPRMTLRFAEDRDQTGQTTLPDAWAWDALAGPHVLTPFAPIYGDNAPEQLVQNAWHVFHGQPFKTATHEIATPQSADVDRYWDLGPMTDAQFAAYEAEQYPFRTADYRAAVQMQSFPQLWATTRLAESNLPNVLPGRRVGPRDIPLTESGMTTENHDRYAGEGYREDYIPDDAGAVITVYARVGMRINVTRVRGYRRTRAKVPTNLGRLTYKMPFGRCDRNVQGVNLCDTQLKASCASIAGSTWTRGVGCQGGAVPPLVVSKTVTEAQALAEFATQENDNEAFDYSWTQGIDQNGAEIPTLRRPDGGVAVHGDHECNDVACTESVYEFDIPLTGAEVAAISAGQEVTKQLLAGRAATGTDELGNPVFEQVYRTVRISVSEA